MKRLSKNFIWLFSANTIKGVLQLAIFIYLARTLLTEAFGYFSYAFAIVAYLMNFVDLGLATYGIREIAKNKSRLFKYTSDIVSFRLIVAFVLYLIFSFIIVLKPGVSEIKLLNLGMGLLLFSFAIGAEWAFQAVEKMHLVFLSFLFSSLFQFVLIFYLVKSPADLKIAAFIIFAAALPVSFIFLKLLKYAPKFKIADFKRIKLYLKSALVIWSITIFSQFYNTFDIVLLGIIKGPKDVGYFTVARQLVGWVIMFAIFLANAALPRLSPAFGKNLYEFNKIRIHFLKVLVLLGACTLLPLGIFTKNILSISVGESYFPADPVIKIFTLAAALVFFNIPFSTSLIAAGYEKKVLRQVIGVAIISFVLNLALIPRFGMIGAAFSYLGAESIALIWIVIIYRKACGGIRNV